MNKLRIGCFGMVCALSGIFVTLLIESVFIFMEREIPMLLFPVLVVVFSGLLFVSGSWKSIVAVWLTMCGFVLAIAVILCGNITKFHNGYDYRNADEDFGIKTFFANQKIMLIVPHQDDELNVLGGTIEEFVRYGSEVYVVYLTNGDRTPAEIRYAEAIVCLQKQGVPEDHVIFMGYGDQWQEDGPHIYNAEPGTIVQSSAGFFATYGTADHPPYRDGRDYTIENLLEDMETMILEYKPDVIFCCDYDEHPDHKALSLIFDKVMGRILKHGSDYQPRVFKGFATRTAWKGIFDFYSLNIKSTKQEYGVDLEPQIEYYRWEDRVRFPADASSFSRSLLGSRLYDYLGAYDSQNAQRKAQGIINGDKVFWERYSTSICSRAEINVSSGKAELLNDFMLLENHNIVDEDRMPYDGVWIPESADTERKISVILPEASDLSSIVLYDHPSLEQNVLEAVIRFDNGDLLTVGPLDPIGAPTIIDIEQKQVSSFNVELSVTEGADAGLTEIEAFAQPRENTKGFVQLMDTNGDFVYDYITEPSGEAVLQIYGYGSVPKADSEYYNVCSDNERCTVKWSEQGIVVDCPPGETAMISVVSKDESVWDCAYIYNPGRLHRGLIKACQLAELFGLDIPKNFQKDEILKHFTVRKAQTKIWNLYYRITH